MTIGGIDYSKIPVVVLFMIGLLCSGYVSLVLIWRGGRFLQSSLGRLAITTLLCLVIFNTGMIAGNTSQLLHPQWFSETTWPNQLFGAFLYTMGVAVSFINLLIAMERYWLICKGLKKLPWEYVCAATIHMLVTVTVMIWAFVSTPPKSFKLPGDALHQNVCLGFVVQYMVVSFVGITVMYLQCFHAVHQSVQTLSGIMTLRTEEFALRKRVITNCVLMVATFVGCYGLFPVTTVFLFFTPEWEEPVLLEVVSLCLVAMDGIVTPLIIWHLNRDLGKSGGGGTEGGGSGMSTRLSQKSKG